MLYTEFAGNEKNFYHLKNKVLLKGEKLLIKKKTFTISPLS